MDQSLQTFSRNKPCVVVNTGFFFFNKKAVFLFYFILKQNKKKWKLQCTHFFLIPTHHTLGPHTCMHLISVGNWSARQMAMDITSPPFKQIFVQLLPIVTKLLLYYLLIKAGQCRCCCLWLKFEMFYYEQVL